MARAAARAAQRYFNASGSTAQRGEDHRPETHLVPIVLQVAAGHRDAVHIYGTDYPTRDGTCVRDYIHVSDLADAHIAALHALDHHDRIVCNLGNGTGFTVQEVIESARARHGSSNPRRGGASSPGRSCRVGRELREGARRARLATAIPRYRHHRCVRVGMAPTAMAELNVRWASTTLHPHRRVFEQHRRSGCCWGIGDLTA